MILKLEIGIPLWREVDKKTNNNLPFFDCERDRRYQLRIQVEGTKRNGTTNRLMTTELR